MTLNKPCYTVVDKYGNIIADKEGLIFCNTIRHAQHYLKQSGFDLNDPDYKIVQVVITQVK